MRMSSFLSAVMDWWSKRTASWVGLRPGFEQGDERIQRLLKKSRDLGLDSTKVVQLMRPKYFLMTSGQYGPVNHLLSYRLRHALSRREDLPHDLHALATHDDVSRKILLDATHAYAEGISHAFYFDVRESKSAAEQQLASVQRAVDSAHGDLLIYLKRRNIQSPFLLDWQQRRSKEKSSKNQSNIETKPVASVSKDSDSSTRIDLPSTGLIGKNTTGVQRDYPAQTSKRQGNRRRRPKRGR